MSQPLQPEGFLLVHSAPSTTRKGKACLSAALFLILTPVPSLVSDCRLAQCHLMVVSLGKACSLTVPLGLPSNIFYPFTVLRVRHHSKPIWFAREPGVLHFLQLCTIFWRLQT